MFRKTNWANKQTHPPPHQQECLYLQSVSNIYDFVAYIDWNNFKITGDAWLEQLLARNRDNSISCWGTEAGSISWAAISTARWGWLTTTWLINCLLPKWTTHICCCALVSTVEAVTCLLCTLTSYVSFYFGLLYSVF